ncbi:division/cell wall cluster transcriptional repressor MraZ [Saccharicrinis sp. GN24d3]|uniref:division/cell wall cluster transcriptional repressor MraZ n=1 Tax=Saccharicrinis sp. GN24d3 TaxID=3458416 RepID=UPI004036898B
MATFIGDFVCKADAKGRFVLPSHFKKVMNAMEENRFVVRKDLHTNCLFVYPYPAWELHIDDIRSKLNMHDRSDSLAYRQYVRTAAEVSFDANGRMLFPKRLMQIIESPKEVVMAGVDEKIEVWNSADYGVGEMSESELDAYLQAKLGGKSNSEEKEGV